VSQGVPVSFFSIHFAKFLAVDADEDLAIHGDSDDAQAQFVMLATKKQ
jgi:hypothetical protein